MKLLRLIPILIGAYIVLFIMGLLTHTAAPDWHSQAAQPWLGPPSAAIAHFASMFPSEHHGSMLLYACEVGGTILLSMLVGAVVVAIPLTPIMMLVWRTGTKTIGVSNHMTFSRAYFWTILLLIWFSNGVVDGRRQVDVQEPTTS